MNETRINQTSELLHLMAHPVRLKILLLLASQGPRNVTSIRNLIPVDQATLSQYLTKFKDKGLLVCRRQGREMHYEVPALILDELTASLLAWVGYDPLIKPPQTAGY